MAASGSINRGGVVLDRWDLWQEGGEIVVVCGLWFWSCLPGLPDGEAVGNRSATGLGVKRAGEGGSMATIRILVGWRWGLLALLVWFGTMERSISDLGRIAGGVVSWGNRVGEVTAVVVRCRLWCDREGVTSVVAGLGMGWALLTGCGLYTSWTDVWVWDHLLGLTFAVYLFKVFIYFCCLVLLRILRVISPYICGVWLVGLCACVCTQSALSALGRLRVPCFVKWSLPPSGRVKLSVVGFIIWRQHSRKAVLKLAIMLRCNRVTYRVIFPLCHCYLKANRAANRALFASWCLLEYRYCVEFPDIISGHTLVAYCNQGFRLNVPPLYSTVSLIKA